MKKVGTIDLPGPPGQRFDYLTMDDEISGFMQPARAASFQFSGKMTQNITGNWRNFPVQKKVHSLAVDTATHRVYAPEQQENGPPVARMIVYEAVQSETRH